MCVASGKCCKFERYGHRLYVTTAELEYFAAVLPVVKGVEVGAKDVATVSLPQFLR